MSRAPLISLHTIPGTLSASSPHLHFPVTASRSASTSRPVIVRTPRLGITATAFSAVGIASAGARLALQSTRASLGGSSRLNHVGRANRCMKQIPTAAVRAMSSDATNEQSSCSLIREILIPVSRHEVAGLLGSRSGLEGTVGVDIGGTLTKIICFESAPEVPSSGSVVGAGPQLRCQIWPTRALHECLLSLRSRLESDGHGWPRISATGGGALKFASQLTSIAGSSDNQSREAGDEIGFDTQDEMACLAAGLKFFQQRTGEELYHFDSSDMYPTKDTMDLPLDPESRCHAARSQSSANELRPTLLANVGTGVSFVLCPSQKRQVDSPAHVEPARRIGGTPLSGSTLLGMIRLLTGKQTYAEMLELASQGDSRKVDLTVGDVYGTDYNGVGLSGHRAAGFLGQVAVGEVVQGEAHSPADIARSLVFATSYNIGQQAVLQARANDAAREICFAGSFASGHPLVMGAIDYAVNANGGGNFVATFLRHESFLGAVGAWAIGAAGRG